MPQYNMHLFAMTLKTKEDKFAPAWIGVTPKGIEVYQVSLFEYIFLRNFTNITRFLFDFRYRMWWGVTKSLHPLD